MNLIQTLEAEEIARLNKKVPEFAPGDTVVVNVNIVEGTRKRLQAYERCCHCQTQPWLKQRLHGPQNLQR